ncbi:angio-associated migratory cell protein [Stomoxys calcitrans]|uniref:angio-associated migratory cell protein n=1 Tax=Stomoxys calcitrans TaxID=35570 RepID=UPI0027E2CE07|nr:angio-associated migratory cell protein [Stomoxys calcitrans]
MRENTPPRPADIDDDVEEIYLDNDAPPEDDDDLEMEEITLEELESRLEGGDYDSDDEARKSPVQDDAIYTFQQHSAPVFACAFHPQNYLCATGGEDDKVFVWNRNNGEVVHEISEHKDTVIEVQFNHDGTYLASGDMAGEIFLHKIQENSGSDEKEGGFVLRKVWEYSMGDMSWMRWHKATNVLMAGSEDGEIYVFRLPAGDCKIFPGTGVRCGSGELTGDGKKLLASYNNGTIKLWDIKTATVVMEIDENHPMFLQEGSTTVSCDKELPIYVTGGESGKIVFSTPNGPVGTVEANGAVECLAFSPSPDFRMAASGTLGGQVAIWDYSKLSMRTQCEHPEDGVTKIQWISEFTILVATLEGNLVAYDARTGQKKFALSGHMAEIYSFAYDPRESLLLTVSEDNSAKIFKVPQLGE